MVLSVLSPKGKGKEFSQRIRRRLRSGARAASGVGEIEAICRRVEEKESPMFERALTSARPNRALSGLAVCLIGSALLLAVPLLAADPKPMAVTDVSLSRPFFNPSLGQKIGISFTVAEPGNLAVQILDRDGYTVRQLVSGKVIEKGKQSFDWDGRDDAGEIVPDEAYSLKINLESSGRTATYFPADVSDVSLEGVTAAFDPIRGILAYRLPKPARVSLAAISSDPHKKSSLRQVIVDGEPRTLGAIVEPWNGYDKSAKVNLAERSGLRIELKARALPENSLITIGNRKARFAEWALKRNGSAPRVRQES
jgi:hypothetical protein